MTVAEAERAGGLRLVQTYGDVACAMYAPQGGPEDLRFIIWAGFSFFASGSGRSHVSSLFCYPKWQSD